MRKKMATFILISLAFATTSSFATSYNFKLISAKIKYCKKEYSALDVDTAGSHIYKMRINCSQKKSSCPEKSSCFLEPITKGKGAVDIIFKPNKKCDKNPNVSILVSVTGKYQTENSQTKTFTVTPPPDSYDISRRDHIWYLGEHRYRALFVF